MSLERTLLAAQGYLELEMPEEALKELQSLPPEYQRREEILQMPLFIFMRAKEWNKALAICAQLREASPEGTTGYIHGAFCLHEVGRTSEAKALLQSGPASLLSEPTYYYNLGCYDAVLGNLTEAAQHLEVSFKMDKNFREIAQHDPDLKPVQPLLAK